MLYIYFLRSLTSKLRTKLPKDGIDISKGRHRKRSGKHHSSSTSEKKAQAKKRRAKTLLEMHFSDGDEEGEEEEERGTVEDNPTDSPNDPIIEVSAPTSPVHEAPHRDEDYQPTAQDWGLVQRDLFYDREDVDVAGSTGNSSSDDDSLNDTMQTVEPIESPDHRDYFLRSRRNEGDNQECCIGLTPSLLHMLDEDDPVGFGNQMDDGNLAQSMTAGLTGKAGETDAEDQIYTSFLQSLFESGPPISSPRETEQPRQMRTPIPEKQACSTAAVNDTTRTTVEGDGEDPDFDVMAEIEAVCCDDLFDELRSDRAVRISKMEAKVSNPSSSSVKRAL